MPGMVELQLGDLSQAGTAKLTSLLRDVTTQAGYSSAQGVSAIQCQAGTDRAFAALDATHNPALRTCTPSIRSFSTDTVSTITDACSVGFLFRQSPVVRHSNRWKSAHVVNKALRNVLHWSDLRGVARTALHLTDRSTACGCWARGGVASLLREKCVIWHRHDICPSSKIWLLEQNT